MVISETQRTLGLWPLISFYYEVFCYNDDNDENDDDDDDDDDGSGGGGGGGGGGSGHDYIEN